MQSSDVLTVYFVDGFGDVKRVRLHGLMGLLEGGVEIVPCEKLVLPQELYRGEKQTKETRVAERAVKTACDCGD
jgi:hypothetical protein